MGYYSALSGRITIDPPLRLDEFAGSRLSVDSDEESSIMLDEYNGQANAVVPRFDEPEKIYDIFACLNEVTRLAGKKHVFSGSLVRSGEEQGDIERYWINADGVYSEMAVITWPDGRAVHL